MTEEGPSNVSPDCVNFDSSRGDYQSVTLADGYTGVVTLRGPLQTHSLYMRNGTINQPGSSSYGTGWTDISVLPLGKMNWTGGTLNATGNTAGVHITAGAVATIAPTDLPFGGGAGTVRLGSQLSFESGTIEGVLTGSAGYFMGGIMEVIDGSTGLKNNEFCSITVAPPTRDFVITDKMSKTGQAHGYWQTDNEGSYKIVGPKHATSDFPFLNVGENAKLSVLNGTNATFKGQLVWPILPFFSLPAGSIVQQWSSDSKQPPITVIEGGATLTAQKGFLMAGGLLDLHTWNKNTATATLAGNLVVTDGNVGFSFDPAVPPFAQGKFVVTGFVEWMGGQYTATIDLGDASNYCTWFSWGQFTVSGSAELLLNPVGVPPNPAGNPEWGVIQSNLLPIGVPAFNSPGNPATFELVAAGKAISVRRK